MKQIARSLAVLSILAWARPLPAFSTETHPSRIVWTLDHLRNDKGLMRCFIFGGPDGYPGEVDKKSLARTEVKIHDGVAQCVFEGFPPGDYALSGYHDENVNNHLDFNFFGIPKEGYAASRDGMGAFGPNFKYAHFKFDGGELQLHSRVFYR